MHPSQNNHHLLRERERKREYQQQQQKQQKNEKKQQHLLKKKMLLLPEECKSVQLQWKSVLIFLRKLKIELPYDYHFWAYAQKTLHPTTEIFAYPCVLLLVKRERKFLEVHHQKAKQWKGGACILCKCSAIKKDEVCQKMGECEMY